MKLTFRAYALTSILGVVMLIVFAVNCHEGLYSTLLFLSRARISIAIFWNFLLMMAVWLVRLAIWLFLGRLRELETEQIIDAGSGFLVDTVMFLVLSSPTTNGVEASVLTLFQNVCFIVLVKGFHLICQIRGVHAFESGLPSSALAGLFSLMTLLLIHDVLLVQYCYNLLQNNSSLYLWLLFEFLGMGIAAVSNLLKFCFNYIDLRMENGWNGKAASIFFVDVVNDVLSLLTVLIFMCLYIVKYPSQLPIHMTANIIQVIRTLSAKVKSFRRCRILINEMSKRFPEATFEELEEADQCIICRDLLYTGSRKLPCGHIFHIDCLKAWFIQQQTCPTCRADVLIAVSTANTTTITEPDETVPQDVRHEDKGQERENSGDEIKEVKLGWLMSILNYVAPAWVGKDSELNDMRWTDETKNKKGFLGLMFPGMQWREDHRKHHCNRHSRRRNNRKKRTDDLIAIERSLNQQIEVAMEMSEFFRQQSLFWMAYVNNTTESQPSNSSSSSSSSSSSIII